MQIHGDYGTKDPVCPAILQMLRYDLKYWPVAGLDLRDLSLRGRKTPSFRV
jgi:hypothetical protein